MSKALVLLSDGAEEMETVISVDVLRRGEVSGFDANCLPSELLPLNAQKIQHKYYFSKKHDLVNCGSWECPVDTPAWLLILN